MSRSRRQNDRVITFWSDRSDAGFEHGFRFGEMTISANLGAPFLADFGRDARFNPAPASRAVEFGGEKTFAGSAYVAARHRNLVCCCDGRRYRLQIEGLGVFLIDPETAHVAHFAGEQNATPETLWQAFLGPCLPLLMVEENRYFLHASAAGRTGLTAFAASSGHGKSTLAEFVARCNGCRRAADDILPICLGPDSIGIGAAFPQLKMPGLGADARHEDRLDRMIVLKPDPAMPRPQLSLLQPAQAVLAASSHTIAGKLFAARHLRQHLSFCRKLAERVECLELRYRQDRSQLPAMVAAIEPL